MKKTSLIAWLILTVVLAGYFSYSLFVSPDKSDFIVGEASHGHYQIEMACTNCHTSAFGGGEVLQEACLDCHKEELIEAEDSHPVKKFTDPRNADRLEKLNAAQCVTCHREHQNEYTHPMGVTLPIDFCFECHQEIAEERPSHEGMGFDTCASAGCHNYHDNKALYEDFLLKHGDKSEPLASMKLKIPNRVESYQAEHPEIRQLSLNEADHNSNDKLDITTHWAASSHAKVGVNCQGCHQDENKQWQEKPPLTMCADCHQDKWQQFTASHHGMRVSETLDLKLPVLTPEQARLPFKPESLTTAVNCQSCHEPHELDLNYASVEACLSCHNDEHSTNFKNSKHFNKALRANQASSDVDVTCATCHLPRYEEGGVIKAMHNPNHNLRPNEKMIRSVCLDCHSLGFSIDALADEKLIKSNFAGQPQIHINSIDMAVERITDN